VGIELVIDVAVALSAAEHAADPTKGARHVLISLSPVLFVA